MVKHSLSCQGVLLHSFRILLVVILVILVILTPSLALTLALVLTLAKHKSPLPHFTGEISQCMLILLGTS
jgi:hypothetical protein